MAKLNGIPEDVTVLDLKNLCWLAYIERMAHDETDNPVVRASFEKWWAVKGTFLLTVPPIRGIYGFDE